MIDTHSHILPGIDDGAKTFEDSILMLKQAEKVGVTGIILTPHYLRGTKYATGNLKKWELYQELKQRATAAGIKVKLYLGNEIYIDEKLPKMLAGYMGEDSEKENNLIYEVSTLNSTKYVLVELPVRAEDISAKTTLTAIVKMGFVPVIAHPERYYYVQENTAMLDDYIELGCLLSGDILALVGKYGKREEKTLRKLLLENKIFCLATDAHKAADYELVDSAKKKLKKLIKNEEAVTRLLVSNPERFLAESEIMWYNNRVSYEKLS